VARGREGEALAVKVAALRPIDAATYVRHALHGAERAWGESNCYVDVWIEVLHALGCDPYACLPFVFGIDWEGDQWTFFKPPHEELVTLYGLDVQELNVWKTLLENVQEQLRGGKLVLTEADAFYLPDTAGTDYRTQHTKTTIGIQEIDVAERTLGYFHNSSYHVLGGADFVGLLRLDAPADPTYMPFFAEFVRTARVVRLEPQALAQRSTVLLRKHLARRPERNPIARFHASFVVDVEGLRSAGLATYHAYAFATIRQLGAAFELGALYLRWLERNGEGGLGEVAAELEGISNVSKSLIMKTARAVASKRPVDFGPMFEEMSGRWERGTGRLAERFGA
jgi:hypothetical protein